MWLSFTALELFPSTHAGMLTITWNHPLPLSHITAYRYTRIVRSNNNKSSLKRPALDQKPLQCASNERESLWETPRGSYLQQGYWRDKRTLPPGVKRCSRVRGWHPARISKQGSERLWNPLTSLVEPNQLFHLSVYSTAWNGTLWEDWRAWKTVLSYKPQEAVACHVTHLRVCLLCPFFLSFLETGSTCLFLPHPQDFSKLLGSLRHSGNSSWLKGERLGVEVH